MSLPLDYKHILKYIRNNCVSQRENRWLSSIDQLDINLLLTHSNLALTYHNPNEAMRVSENFSQKNL